MGSDIAVNYPSDIIALIFARKSTMRVGATSSRVNVEPRTTTTEPEHIPKPPLPLQTEEIPTDPNVALGN